jgi:hypothetical protein
MQLHITKLFTRPVSLDPMQYIYIVRNLKVILRPLRLDILLIRTDDRIMAQSVGRGRGNSIGKGKWESGLSSNSVRNISCLLSKFSHEQRNL